MIHMAAMDYYSSNVFRVAYSPLVVYYTMLLGFVVLSYVHHSGF